MRERFVKDGNALARKEDVPLVWWHEQRIAGPRGDALRLGV
jgi:hypothetical protein